MPALRRSGTAKPGLGPRPAHRQAVQSCAARCAAAPLGGEAWGKAHRGGSLSGPQPGGGRSSGAAGATRPGGAGLPRPPRARAGGGRAAPRGRPATPWAGKAGPPLRTGWSLHPTWRARRGTPAPYALASTLGQRRTRQASEDRSPIAIGWRSSGGKNRTNTAVGRRQTKILHFPKTYPAKALATPVVPNRKEMRHSKRSFGES